MVARVAQAARRAADKGWPTNGTRRCVVPASRHVQLVGQASARVARGVSRSEQGLGSAQCFQGR